MLYCIDTVVSVSIRQCHLDSVTVRIHDSQWGILQFEGESCPCSWSHKRLYSILPYLHVDGAVASPRVQDIPFPLQPARFPSDGSARSCYALVDEQVRSFQLHCVTHNRRLRVMRCEADEDVPMCRTILRPLSHAMGADHVAVGDLDVEFSGCNVPHERVRILVSRPRQTTKHHRVAPGVGLGLLFELFAPLFQAYDPHLQALDFGVLPRDRIV